MDIIQEAKNLALREIEKFGTPTPIHFEIAEKKALELAERFKADKKIVQIGVYLMDLKLGEAFSQGKLEEHVKMSIQGTEIFLKRFNLDEETKKKIINCIEAHHGEAPFICKEAEICANADCYRFLNPRGFFAYFMLIGKRDWEFKKALDFAEKKIDEKYKILSLDICKKELEDYYHQFKKLIKEAKE